MKTKITKEMFLNSDVSQVAKIYVGKRNCCRCGCGGDYFTDGNDKRLKRAKKLINDGAVVDYYDTCVDIEIGINRSLTIYFN